MKFKKYICSRCNDCCGCIISYFFAPIKPSKCLYGDDESEWEEVKDDNDRD